MMSIKNTLSFFDFAKPAQIPAPPPPTPTSNFFNPIPSWNFNPPSGNSAPQQQHFLTSVQVPVLSSSWPQAPVISSVFPPLSSSTSSNFLIQNSTSPSLSLFQPTQTLVTQQQQTAHNGGGYSFLPVGQYQQSPQFLFQPAQEQSVITQSQQPVFQPPAQPQQPVQSAITSQAQPPKAQVQTLADVTQQQTLQCKLGYRLQAHNGSEQIFLPDYVIVGEVHCDGCLKRGIKFGYHIKNTTVDLCMDCKHNIDIRQPFFNARIVANPTWEFIQFLPTIC
jgi:hypothetical protein